MIKNKNIDHLKSLISALPEEPGVYQFFDENNTIIYVGKAKRLKRRVASYFNKVHDNAKTNIMVRKISEIRHIVVNTEEDALLLENNLIKKHQPRYNVLLKDDKSFPWICIKKENFPRVFVTRNLVKDGSEYFGPYTSVKMVKTLMDMIRSLYKLRTCNLNLNQEAILNGKFKVCLEYHIGNCKAPCVGKISQEEYNETIQAIRNILKGNIRMVTSHLKSKMTDLAEEFKFEEAHIIKEKLELLDKYQSKSTIVNPSINNIDVYSILEDEESAYVNFLKVVNGAIIQAHTIELKKKIEESKEDLLLLAITEIRQKIFSTAKEILVPFDIDLPYSGVKCLVPQRGDKRKLLDLSLRNVKYYRLEKLKQGEKSRKQSHSDRILERMKNDLRLKDLPVHIECFDNSNIQGTNPVASCVVFRNARPYKKDYRHFNIKTVVGANDFASMEEIIYRRYKRLLEENQTLPQLIVIDGGKGQLGAALNSLGKLDLRGKISVIGIAKKLEEIYFPGDPYPLYLDKNSETLKTIQHLRNESHRFAITFHRQKRSKAFVGSELDRIEGIGPKSVQKLIQRFKSVDNVKKATINEISAEIGNSKALSVWKYFH
ncbi:excinuclease ABC subunit UvrC [Marinifilum caeruleilacunae]|uniref:UvrABC system protein C n=1 Tax=Marinifilum caeruleilacunae TaxID=2499076 RepID=A0ABX1WV87_9BACT|nr:excinuclease ABC subunit UvrC [Marinifilum caeruleilacunae]NOU59825.1 excinuclease ABC subunit UvrC [Marinifilum caeruleilacunae]